MQPQGRRRTRKQRSDYAPTVRQRAQQVGESIERHLVATDQGKFALHSIYVPINNSDTTFTITPPAGKRLRIVRVRAWPDTNDLNVLEVFFGAVADITLADIGDQLFIEPFNAVHERFNISFSVGSGPISKRGSPLNLRLQSAVAAQTFHYIIWWTEA